MARLSEYQKAFLHGYFCALIGAIVAQVFFL
jgi:hypothetical protein